MNGLIGKKLGMTSIFDANGKRVACTVVEAGPCVVTQIKNEDTDGYNAVQIAFGEKKEKRATAAEKGHFKKAKTNAASAVVEYRDWDADAEIAVGSVLDVNLFEEDEYVDIVCDFLELLPKTTTIQRLAGNGLKSTLVAPSWLAKKWIILKKTLNHG